MSEPALYPGDAPFVADTIPSGWSRPLTTEEADAANVLYPVPPYGSYYNDPNGPPVPPVGQAVDFLRLNTLVQGLSTQANLRNEDMDKVEEGDIIVIWPIHAGIPGVLDDIGTRPVRILTKSDEKITFSFDSTGLDISGVVLVGIKYRDTP